MIMEVRHVATVRDLMAIELECSKSQCRHKVTINLNGAINDTMECPGCGEVWWRKEIPSNEYNLLSAVIGLLRGTVVGRQLTEGQKRARSDSPPIVQLVFTGCDAR